MYVSGHWHYYESLYPATLGQTGIGGVPTQKDFVDPNVTVYGGNFDIIMTHPSTLPSVVLARGQLRTSRQLHATTTPLRTLPPPPCMHAHRPGSNP